MMSVPLILFAEDEFLIALPLVETLRDLGYDVIEALNGLEAIEVLEARASEIAVLVTDIRMPQLDGWAVARRARELNPAIGIVYHSGDSLVDWTSNGLPDSEMLQKPYSASDLALAVAKQLP